MTARKSCLFGESGLFEHLLFLNRLRVLCDTSDIKVVSVAATACSDPCSRFQCHLQNCFDVRHFHAFFVQ